MVGAMIRCKQLDGGGYMMRPQESDLHSDGQTAGLDEKFQTFLSASNPPLEACLRRQGRGHGSRTTSCGPRAARK